MQLLMSVRSFRRIFAWSLGKISGEISDKSPFGTGKLEEYQAKYHGKY